MKLGVPIPNKVKKANLLASILAATQPTDGRPSRDLSTGAQQPPPSGKKRSRLDSNDDGPSARKLSLVWSDLLKGSGTSTASLSHRFLQTVEWIKPQDLTGATDLTGGTLEEGLETVAAAEPGDFVAVLRHLPATILTWSTLMKKRMDFFRILQVSPAGVELVFADSVGPDDEDDDDEEDCPDNLPIWIPSNGTVFRATGRVLTYLRRTLGTKTTASDSSGHKNTFCDSISGTLLRYTDKTNVAGRVPASRVMRRMSTPEVLHALMDDDVHFDASKAWAKLEREATIRVDLYDPTRKTPLPSQKWTAIQQLPVTKRGKEYFLRLAEGQWGGRPDESNDLSLGWFSRVPLTSKDKHDNVGDKLAIATTVENFSRFLVFCHGGSWEATLQPFVSRVREGDWSENVWEASYLRHELERRLVLFYHCLYSSSTQSCTNDYGGDLSSPATVEAWMARLLQDLVPTESRQNKFLRDHPVLFTRPTPATGAATSKPHQPQSKQPISERNSSTVAQDKGAFCRYHFLNQLGVHTLAGKPYRPCQDQKCAYPHIDTGTLPKSQLADMVGRVIALPNFGSKVKAQLEKVVSSRL